MADSHRISITGMGAVTPVGATASDLWAGALRAQPTTQIIPHLQASGHSVPFGSPAVSPQVPEGMSAKNFRRMDRFAQLGVSAGVEAYHDSGVSGADPTRVAVVVGNAVGGRAASDRESAQYAVAGPSAVSPLMPTMTMPNAAAAMIAIHLGISGPAHTVATTCASGLDAIGYGMTLLRSGRVDVVLAGGCESTLTPVTMAAFAALNALSTRREDPSGASRPFDRDRDGFVMGEGGAFVVLEREKDAVARGARIWGTVLGYGSTTDAFHLTQPHPGGVGAEAAIRQALAEAGVGPDEISHVNSHGTSTPLNDKVEAQVIHRVFTNHSPPVTALKGVTGHMLGASGTAEVIVTVRSVSEGIVPPVANHSLTDPECPVDVVTGDSRQLRPGPALTNSFGFGGHNAALVVV